MFNKKFSLTLVSLTLSDHKIPVGQSIAITVKNMREYGFLRTRFFPYKSGNVDSVLIRKNTGETRTPRYFAQYIFVGIIGTIVT